MHDLRKNQGAVKIFNQGPINPDQIFIAITIALNFFQSKCGEKFSIKVWLK